MRLPTSHGATVIELKGHSLNWFVRQYPLLFHTQDWYRAEPFAGFAQFGMYEDDGTPLPTAVFACLMLQAHEQRQVLPWPDFYRWTTDFDSEGHPVYVGRTAQYGCLQIHRRLTEDIR